MPETMAVVAIAVISGILGAILVYVTRRVWTATKIRNAESYAERLVTDARTKQKEIVLEGKDEVLVPGASMKRLVSGRADLQRQERLLLDRSESLDHGPRPSTGGKRSPRSGSPRPRPRKGLAALRDKQLTSLEQIGGLSAAEARQELIRSRRRRRPRPPTTCATSSAGPRRTGRSAHAGSSPPSCSEWRRTTRRRRRSPSSTCRPTR